MSRTACLLQHWIVSLMLLWSMLATYLSVKLPASMSSLLPPDANTPLVEPLSVPGPRLSSGTQLPSVLVPAGAKLVSKLTGDERFVLCKFGVAPGVPWSPESYDTAATGGSQATPPV
eukprot:4493530-Amphidinium_carterae.2